MVAEREPRRESRRHRNTSDHSEGEDYSDNEDVLETTVGASGPNIQTASRDLLFSHCRWRWAKLARHVYFCAE